MRPRAIIVLAFMNAACGDATDPSDEVLICRGNISWMAIQVANEPLQIVEGSRRLRRSQPVMVIEHDLLRGLRLLYMSAEQAAAMLTCPGNTGTGPPTTGSVVPASVSSGFATISARSVSTTASGSFPTFEIPVFPKPFDLVANRSSDRKTVVRRHLDGNTIAPIDFDTEGFFPDAQTITVTGGDPRFPFHTISYLVTAGGTTGLLGRTPLPAPIGTTPQIYMAPASHLVEGDLHSVHITTENVRGVQLFARNPSGRTVEMGARANDARNVDGTVILPSQSEYGAEINIMLCAPPPSTGPTSAIIIATKDYFGGTPAIWSLPIPDAASLPDVPATLVYARTWFACQTMVHDRPFGASVKPFEGEIRRFAGVVH